MRRHVGACIVLCTVCAGAVLSAGWMPPAERSTVNLDDERRVTVETDHLFYRENDTIFITMTNTGKLPIAGGPFLDIYQLTAAGHKKLFEGYPNELPPGLALNESFTFAWHQNLRDNTTAPRGKYHIMAGFQTCGGILASDDAYFYLQQPPALGPVAGGLRASISVRNGGAATVTELPWSVELAGALVAGIGMSGTVGVLPVGEEVLLRFFPLGFGPAVMTVTVADTHASAAVLLLGPFVAVA